MNLRLFACLLLAGTSVLACAAWWLLPRLWPEAVIAYSPFLRPAIRAEAHRGTGIVRLRVPWVDLDERLRADRAAGAGALVAALRDAEPATRQTAARHLRWFDLDVPERAGLLASLAGCIGDGDELVRMAVVGQLAAGRSHDPLVEAALCDPSAYVRQIAVQGLAPRADPRLLPGFARLLADPSDAVAVAAAQALARYDLPAATDLLFTALAANRRGAVAAAGASLLERRLPPERRRELLALLVAALRDDGVPRSALDADWLLGNCADEAVPLLHAALDDADYQCRQFAADLLRQRAVAPSPRLIAVTIEGLRDDAYPWSRDGGMSSYLRNAKDGTRWLWIHQEHGTAALRDALAASSDAQQRFLCAWLLAMREDAVSAPAACAELIPRLRIPAGNAAALWAIQALYRLGAPARPAVEAALPGVDERQAACLALLLRDWDDPPKNRYDAARRGRLALSHLYHDPAWEPALAAPGNLPAPFPDIVPP